MKLLFLFCLSFYLVIGKHEQYDGHVLYEVYPKNVDEMRLVNNVVNQLELDIWAFATLNNPGEVFVSKLQKEHFESSMKAAGVGYTSTIENIRELLEKEDEKLRAAKAKRQNKTKSKSSELTFDEIYTYDEVVEYMNAIAEEYPGVANMIEAGKSVEGRPIPVLEISTTGLEDFGKPIIFVQSLLHAREWVTLPPTLYAIHKLLTDVEYTDLLNYIDWIIMPIANPDGYEWSHTDDRFWRKNRRAGLTPGDSCVGVDLNRNFDIDWGTISSDNPCSNTFHGAAPTSEPETLAISNILAKYNGRITMYEDLHSTGSMILYGWGNGTLASNALMLHLCGVKIAEAIDKVKWEEKPYYRVGNTLAVIQYAVSGCSSDYAQYRGVPYSYTYELPAHLGGQGVDRFLVAPEFIEQAAIETWDGLVASARHLLS